MAKFQLYRRGGSDAYYLQDNETGRQESLKTRRAEEARRVLNARNEAAAVPEVTRKIAAAYLWASGPGDEASDMADGDGRIQQAWRCFHV